MAYLIQSLTLKMFKESKENTHLYQYPYLTSYHLFEMRLKQVICSYMKHKKPKNQQIASSRALLPFPPSVASHLFSFSNTK